MKYKISFIDGIDLLVTADSEIVAVKKAKKLKDSIMLKDESNLIDWKSKIVEFFKKILGSPEKFYSLGKFNLRGNTLTFNFVYNTEYNDYMNSIFQKCSNVGIECIRSETLCYYKDLFDPSYRHDKLRNLFKKYLGRESNKFVSECFTRIGHVAIKTKTTFEERLYSLQCCEMSMNIDNLKL